MNSIAADTLVSPLDTPLGVLSALIVFATAEPAVAAPPTFSGPTPFTAGAFPSSVPVADLNGDGRPDLVTANSNTNGAAGNTVLTQHDGGRRGHTELHGAEAVQRLLATA